MKVLVCGGYGFIGSQLVNLLTRRGYEVYTLSQRHHDKIEKVNEIVYNKIDKDEITEIIRKIEPIYTFYLATKYDDGDLNKIIDVNITLPTIIMNALSTLPHSSRNLILTDSYWSLGDENSKGIPLDNYAAAKSAVSEFAKTYSYYEGISIINLVVYGTYGNKDLRGKILDTILDSIKNNKELSLSKGEQFLDLVHVSDICAAFMIAVEIINNNNKLRQGYLLNYSLGSEKPIQIKEVIKVLGKKYDTSNIRLGDKAYRLREIFEPQYAYPVLPGWVPKEDIYSYIESYMNDYK